MFANPRDAEKDWSNPAKTITVNEGGLDKIKDRTSPAIPPALVQLQEFSLSSIRDVTGASVEMLGLADRDQPASLEYQRRQSAMTILASCGFHLRGEPEVGVRKLYISTVGASAVQVDIRRMLSTGETRFVRTPQDAEAHLHILRRRVSRLRRRRRACRLSPSHRVPSSCRRRRLASSSTQPSSGSVRMRGST